MITQIIILITTLLIGATILLLFGYLVTILCVKCAKKCSTETATNIVNTFLNSILNGIQSNSVSTNSYEYPIYIGYNGYAIRHDLVMKAFEKLARYWHIFYYDCFYANHPHLVVYQFRVYDPVHPDMTVGRLERLAQNVSEEALANHMREWNCFVPVDCFVTVRIRDDLLQIAIAKNEFGFESIAKMRR